MPSAGRELQDLSGHLRADYLGKPVQNAWMAGVGGLAFWTCNIGHFCADQRRFMVNVIGSTGCTMLTR